MGEDDKMRLRYIAEQKDRAANHLSRVTHSKRRERFNLDDSDDSNQDVAVGFTHRGRPLAMDDDFNEKIAHSSDDEDDKDKGKLTEEMVNEMNFGRGKA